MHWGKWKTQSPHRNSGLTTPLEENDRIRPQIGHNLRGTSNQKQARDFAGQKAELLGAVVPGTSEGKDGPEITCICIVKSLLYDIGTLLFIGFNRTSIWK